MRIFCIFDFSKCSFFIFQNSIFKFSKIHLLKSEHPNRNRHKNNIFFLTKPTKPETNQKPPSTTKPAKQNQVDQEPRQPPEVHQSRQKSNQATTPATNAEPPERAAESQGIKPAEQPNQERNKPHKRTSGTRNDRESRRKSCSENQKEKNKNYLTNKEKCDESRFSEFFNF